jgi:hypothetical protein
MNNNKEYVEFSLEDASISSSPILIRVNKYNCLDIKLKFFSVWEDCTLGMFENYIQHKSEYKAAVRSIKIQKYKNKKINNHER